MIPTAVRDIENIKRKESLIQEIIKELKKTNIETAEKALDFLKKLEEDYKAQNY